MADRQRFAGQRGRNGLEHVVARANSPVNPRQPDRAHDQGNRQAQKRPREEPEARIDVGDLDRSRDQQKRGEREQEGDQQALGGIFEIENALGVVGVENARHQRVEQERQGRPGVLPIELHVVGYEDLRDRSGRVAARDQEQMIEQGECDDRIMRRDAARVPIAGQTRPARGDSRSHALVGPHCDI